jgi:hypothetical protein
MFVSVEELLKHKDFLKRRLFDELEAVKYSQIDLVYSLRMFFSLLGRAHKDCRKLLSPEVDWSCGCLEWVFQSYAKKFNGELPAHLYIEGEDPLKGGVRAVSIDRGWETSVTSYFPMDYERLVFNSGGVTRKHAYPWCLLD